MKKNSKNFLKDNNIKIVIIIVLLSLILRLGYAFVYHDPVTSDSAQYDALAYNAWKGKGYLLNNSLQESNVSAYAFEAEPSAWRPPGYPFFLVSVYTLFGHNYGAVHIIQVLLSVITGILIYIIGKRLWSHEAGVVGLLFHSIWPPFIVLPAQLLTETLNNFLVAAAIYLAVKIIYAEEQKAYLWMLLGLITGYTAITRPTYLLFPLVFVPVLLLLKKEEFFSKNDKENKNKKDKLFSGRNSKKILGFAALSIIIFLAIIGSWTYRNYVELRAFVPGSTMSGLGVYFGTTPFNTSINGNPQPWDPVYSNITNTNKSEVEKSDLLTQAGIKNMKEHPFRTFGIKIENIYRIWNMPYIARTINHNSYGNLMDNNWFIRTFLPKGSIPFFIFLYGYIAIHAIIIMLFIISLFVEKWWKNKGIIAIYSIIIYLNIMIFLTFGIDRYVLAVMPFLTVAAADLVIKRMIRRKKSSSHDPA